MRLGLVALTAAGLFSLAGTASAQVIYYSTTGYYNAPTNPLVRTYSTPVMYSTYTSPIVVPTRFVTPPFGTVGYDSPPAASGSQSAGRVQPYPAFRQVGFTTYSPAPLPAGAVYYSGDAYNAPSTHYYTRYYDRGPAGNFGAFASPYTQFGSGAGYGR